MLVLASVPPLPTLLSPAALLTTTLLPLASCHSSSDYSCCW